MAGAHPAPYGLLEALIGGDVGVADVEEDGVRHALLGEGHDLEAAEHKVRLGVPDGKRLIERRG